MYQETKRPQLLELERPFSKTIAFGLNEGFHLPEKQAVVIFTESDNYRAGLVFVIPTTVPIVRREVLERDGARLRSNLASDRIGHLILTLKKDEEVLIGSDILKITKIGPSFNNNPRLKLEYSSTQPVNLVLLGKSDTEKDKVSSLVRSSFDLTRFPPAENLVSASQQRANKRILELEKIERQYSWRIYLQPGSGFFLPDKSTLTRLEKIDFWQVRFCFFAPANVSIVRESAKKIPEPDSQGRDSKVKPRVNVLGLDLNIGEKVFIGNDCLIPIRAWPIENPAVLFEYRSATFPEILELGSVSYKQAVSFLQNF